MNQELDYLIKQANGIYQENFTNETYFERSIFINWTCSIADCKYCYLSTKPKHKQGVEPKAIRSKESILAEVLLCKKMGWRVGYITGGLRVESVEYLADLLQKINLILGEKTMMNFGPYAKSEIIKLKPYVRGMGSAIESFNEELHNFICPSKPLKSLLLFLKNLEEENLQKLITIILGIGEKKEDLKLVVEKIKEYGINQVQLCFLKPIQGTIFEEVPSPDPDYMAWWISQLRINCPNLIIKVALVKDRIGDVELYLKAGVNGFTRFMVLSDLNTKYSRELAEGCKKAGRNLVGYFNDLPQMDWDKEINNLPFEEELKEKIRIKLLQYVKRISKNFPLAINF
jgi:biotin synthase-like enzyme